MPAFQNSLLTVFRDDWQSSSSLRVEWWGWRMNREQKDKDAEKTGAGN